jgi:glycosyltransferase involved in cell wall biosynthesis
MASGRFSPLRICLDARLHDGELGGVQQVVTGLATAFSSFDDGDEEYYFLVTSDARGWVRSKLSGPCRLLETEPWRPASAGPGNAPAVPQSDGTIERAGIDLMHFTVQSAFQTRVPSVFQPHDLLHLHMPGLLGERQLASRTAGFPRFCADARMVVALSSWSQRDIVAAYDLPEERVQVVPNAPGVDAQPPSRADLDETRRRLALPDAFVFFPAATWEHKNHVALLDALALLRDREGLVVPLVCSGLHTRHFPIVESRVAALGLERQVHFVATVRTADVRCLYAMARAVIFPSLFEGFGIPLVEAFATGVPVACSNVTCLPDLARDAALLFDPNRVDDIAAAIARVWTDAELRSTLITRGRARAGDFSWDRSARLLRAHYRRLMGRAMTDDDRARIAAPPVV